MKILIYDIILMGDKMKKIVVVGFGRSAIGKFGGSLKNTNLSVISSKILNKVLDKFKIKKEYIDELIIGNVLSAGLGQNISRQIAINSNLKNETISYTVNYVCGSSLKALELGMNSLLLNKSNLIVVGGIENMSNSPYLINSRFSKNLGNFEMKDELLIDGLIDAKHNIHMGEIAENLAKKYNFSFEELNQIAFDSQQKSIIAHNNNYFDEIIKIDEIENDEGIRFDTNLEKLSKLKGAFIKNGVVTAGNSSTINDGVAFVVITTYKFAKENNLDILFELVDIENIGVDPLDMAIAPIYSTEKILKKHNLKISDIDKIELNEAFASQVLAFLRHFNLNYKDINDFGGAISLGHPIGASGIRILTTLFTILNRSNKNLGLASLCIGGGFAMTAIVRRYENE